MSQNAVLEKPGTPKKSKKPNLKITVWCACAIALLVLVLLVVLFVRSDEGVVFPVHINEILASNSRFPNADGRCSDYIELYNSGDYAVDISGFQLGDMEGYRHDFMATNGFDVEGVDYSADVPRMDAV